MNCKEMKEILLTGKRGGIPCVIIFPCLYVRHFDNFMTKL